MTGGMAFVYDADGSFERRANPESIVWQRLAIDALGRRCCSIWSRAHHAATDSKWSASLLDDWGRAIDHFWQVVPKEMLTRLAASARRPGGDGRRRNKHAESSAVEARVRGT